MIPQIGGGGMRRGNALTSQTRGPRGAWQEATAQWEAEAPADGKWWREKQGDAKTSRTRGLGGVWRVTDVGENSGHYEGGPSTRPTAPWWRGTAWRLLNGNGWRNGSLTAMNSARAPRQQWTARRLLDGEGWCKHNDDGPRAQRWWAAMDGTMATWRWWTAWRQLDVKGWRDDDLTTMDNKERRKRDGDVDTAGGGSNKGQRGIII